MGVGTWVVVGGGMIGCICRWLVFGWMYGCVGRWVMVG